MRNRFPIRKPFGGDEFSVPCEDRVGRHNGGNLAQHFPSQRPSFGRQSTALVVCETNASPPRIELLFQYPVLFDQVGDYGCLLPPDPAGERGQKELEMYGFNHLGSITGVW